MTPYINDLGSCIDLDAIRAAKIKIGVDPLGGAAVHYWGPIAESTASKSQSSIRSSIRASRS